MEPKSVFACGISPGISPRKMDLDKSPHVSFEEESYVQNSPGIPNSSDAPVLPVASAASLLPVASLSYNDIIIAPQKGKLQSRKDAITSVQLTKTIKQWNRSQFQDQKGSP